MTIEETLYKLKEKYQKHSYGVKYKMDTSETIEEYLLKNPSQDDLILQRKDGNPINIDDYIILSHKKYNNRIENAKLTAKLELLNEIFEDNPDKCCITGCQPTKTKKEK